MSLTIRRGEAPVSDVIADRRLYTSADRTTVLEAGHPDCAYLFAVPGTAIPADDVARYGLTVVDGCVVVAPVAPTAAESDAPAASKPRGRSR